MVDAPSVPKPPASDTAAARRWYDTPPMPASITGCSTPSISVKRVRMPMTLVTPHSARSLSTMPKGRVIGLVALGAVAVAAIGLVIAWAVDERAHDDRS